jgi:hypothetical protein
VAKQGYPELAKGEIELMPMCEKGETSHIIRRYEYIQGLRRKLKISQKTQKPQTAVTAVAKK